MMGIFSPSFLLGIVVLFYCSSFVLFALLRIATGVSIQRIGYFSLRRIAYTVKDGIRIDLRGLGLHLHRPTFAQPTWISLRLTELKVTIDLELLFGGKDVKDRHNKNPADGPYCALDSDKDADPNRLRRTMSNAPRSRTWKRLTQIKEKIKQLHGKIHWIRLVDFEIINSSCVIKDVGTVQVGLLNMAVDVRRKTVDRGRLFRHKKAAADTQRPAEWIFGVRGVLFTPEGKESLEVLDICNLNIHGLLYKDLAGLRDVSISLKLGRIHVPYDDILLCHKRIMHCRYAYGRMDQIEKDIFFTDFVEELDAPGSQEGDIVQTVSDSKEFISSLLRGIQEIQLAISFIGMSKRITAHQADGSPLYFNFSMNEFGIDLYRLDPRSPAHRMYFSSKDIAHQALLAAISIALSMDYGGGKPERLVYIPMATTTVKTTLPSKTVTVSESNNAAERNANMLFANLVVTSPSIDLEPKHMPILLAMGAHQETHRASPNPSQSRHHIFSRLLPKASIKFSIQEPVARVVIPPLDVTLTGTDEYDLLISSISSISMDLESFHSSGGELHYALTANLRISSHQFYYQSAVGERHNLFITDTFELKGQLSATPELCAIVSGNVKDLSVHLVRPEISRGLNQVMQQITGHVTPMHPPPTHSSNNHNLLRRLPVSLVQFHFQGSNMGIELAGVDKEVSKDTRGVAFQIESWNAEYKVHKDASIEKRAPYHRGLSSPGTGDDSLLNVPSTPNAKKGVDTTDGRRLTLQMKGFEGFIVEGVDSWEPEPFISAPRFELAISTSSDVKGPILHFSSHLKSLHLQYSLYRYYAIGVANLAFQDIFASTRGRTRTAESPVHGSREGQGLKNVSDPKHAPELVTFEVKTGLLQLKATMPSDPQMMLQIYGGEFGRNRWAMPYARSRLSRLYAEAPRVKSTWVRIVSIKQLRVDLRESRKKVGKNYLDERSVDVSSDFMRLAVPHQLVPHKIFDNITNVMKATEQLHHRFKTGTNDYILQKKPVEPRKVPRISLRSKIIMIEMEDGLFDWKLGTIYRAGLIEQNQRLAREAAFELKAKRIHEQYQRRESSRYRSHPSYTSQRGRSKPNESESAKERNKSRERRSHSFPAYHFDRHRGRPLRYDPDCPCEITGAAEIAEAEARNKLDEYNARSWKQRIARALQYQKRSMHDIRSIFKGNDETPEAHDSSETIVALPDRPGLMSALISDLHIIVDKPSFPLEKYSEYLHAVGKGMPRDMEYSLLIPMNLQINMGEARVTLRDYPLPLLHVPAIRPGQSPRLPSWSLKTDFIIAEEYRDSESTRQVMVEVVPPEKITSPEEVKRGFAIDVRRTVSPVKTYSNVEIAIETGNPTSITWGTSYQPAIQDMMQIIEGFTKPQADPSERVGFWDKIRLNFHSRVNVAWRGQGDVHLKLKGSRDPYIVTGQGAGFVMCFRDQVSWGIHQTDDPKKFMIVHSGEFVLAIPDYSQQARIAANDASRDSDSVISGESAEARKDNAMFKKTIMKLSGNVRWVAGLVFERDLEGGKRSFKFLPHYNVVLKTPTHAKASQGKDYDAFRGFRSQYIHLSIAVAAPKDRDWSATNPEPSSSYNSVHLTPRFFTHFFSWWSLFSGTMSLPIRQGILFPGVEKSSKKFGRHLATIKYNLLLSPLFIAHVYKHKDAEDYSDSAVSATGLKLRINSFMLDLHQRREEFATQGKGRVKQIKTSGMRINQAQLDFVSADMRAVSASITGTSAEDIKQASDTELAAYRQPLSSANISQFAIPGGDDLWIDMDDFEELDWILPVEIHPQVKIMPLAFSPRFTYFRQTDHEELQNIEASTGSSPFGNEPTHFCIMSQNNEPQRVQYGLIKERVVLVNEQIETHKRSVGEQELLVVRDGHKDNSLKVQYDLLLQQGQLLEDKKKFMQTMLYHLSRYLKENHCWTAADNEDLEQSPETSASSESSSEMESEDHLEALSAHDASNFTNRFIIHNLQLKWNNSLRNIILRYVHQVSHRRGFVYYMSRPAVKFIIDIVEEQLKSKQRQQGQPPSHPPSTHPSPSISSPNEDDAAVEERIRELLKDGQNFVNASDPPPSEKMRPRRNTGNLEQNIAEAFVAQNSYHLHLIAPQIQLQSEKNAKAVLLVTAKGMQLKVLQIMDKTRMADDVSGLVQRRFSLEMDAIQFFVANQKALSQYLHLYASNRYGTLKESSWPPWVAPEVNFDFKLNPFGFSRIIQKTSASLRYDKYNTLRLKYNDEISKDEPGHTRDYDDPESRIDHLWVEFPQLRASCDSTQYYAMYLIVTDLLLYSEPLEKIRSERLEKIMLAADFSDLTGTPEMVVSLQERIRQLEEIKGQFQVYSKSLDRQGWLDRLQIERDLTSCEDELFFTMKAISTSQRKSDDRSNGTTNNGLLRWNLSASEVVWHLMRDHKEPLMEIQLNNATYYRTDNSDGSNVNIMEIERLHGLNLLPDALYPEMLAPFFENPKQKKDDLTMFRVKWNMLEAIAGIPVLDQFEVVLFPLKVQLEREVGKKLFEYIFPEDGGKSPGTSKSMPSLQDEDEESDIESTFSVTPARSPNPDTEISTRAGSLELRLRPTLRLSDIDTTPRINSEKSRSPGMPPPDSHRFKLFQNLNRSKSATRSPAPGKPSMTRKTSRRRSQESLRSLVRAGTAEISSTNLAAMNSSEKSRRFGIHRNNSGLDKDKSSDDLTQMMTRASNYMTLAYVKISSVVLCLSYKGKDSRNLEDVHNFVFRMPVVEYRNKTWSSRDLVVRLKKDVIKALISHTGAIIGNKFTHRAPNKHAQSRLREIANSSSLLPNTANLTNALTKRTTAIHNRSQSSEVGDSTSITSEVTTTDSYASSLDSLVIAAPRKSIASASGKGLGLSIGGTSASTGESSPVSEVEGNSQEETTVEQNQRTFRQNSLAQRTPLETTPEAAELNHRSFTQNSFTRRITSEGSKLFHYKETNKSSDALKDGVNGHARKDKDDSDHEDGKSEKSFARTRSRKVSVVHLGKKILGGLN